VAFKTPLVAKKQPLLASKRTCFLSALFKLGHFARIFSTGIVIAEWINRNDDPDRTSIGRNR
jgi:hypothetical protein